MTDTSTTLSFSLDPLTAPLEGEPDNDLQIFSETHSSSPWFTVDDPTLTDFPVVSDYPSLREETPAPQPAAKPTPTPAPPSAPGPAPRRRRSWSSDSDDSFRAAEQLASPTTGTPTDAGLPRRVPRANLVPGSMSHRPVRIVRDPGKLAAQTDGYFRGRRQGQQAAREQSRGWEFNREQPAGAARHR